MEVVEAGHEDVLFFPAANIKRSSRTLGKILRRAWKISRGGASICLVRGFVVGVVVAQEEDIRRRTSAAGINADAASAGLGGVNVGGAGVGGGDEATQELAAAVESLPKLLDQKKGLEMHTNILKVSFYDVQGSEWHEPQGVE